MHWGCLEKKTGHWKQESEVSRKQGKRAWFTQIFGNNKGNKGTVMVLNTVEVHF